MILDLPLPIFVLLLSAAIIAVLFGIWKSWKEDNKIQAVSYSLLAFCGLGTIAYRIFRDQDILVNNLWLFVPFAILTIGTAAVCGGISNYKIAKRDEAKRRFFMRKVYFFSVVFIILGLLGIYLFHGK